ncbi:MAG: cytochrome c [Dehalococcoidia bacterium]
MKAKLAVLPVTLVSIIALVACGGETSPATTLTSEVQSTATAAPSGGDPVAGQQKFGTCAGCHAADATGIPGLGVSLVGTDFIADNSDQELLDFIKQGRPASDPANTTGVDMPPKGGNPALSDDDILDIIAYLRTLQ